MRDRVEVNGHPGYFVTPDGRVFSTRGRKGNSSNWLKPMLGRGRYRQYLSVSMKVDGKRFHRMIHRLVAEAFCGPKPFEGAVVRHLDGNSMNNDYSNLAWGSRKDDTYDKERLGRIARGSKHVSARLTEEKIIEIRARANRGEVRARLAEEFRISQGHLHRIIENQCWKHTGE